MNYSIEEREDRMIGSRPLSPAGGARPGGHGTGGRAGMESTELDLAKVENDYMDVCMEVGTKNTEKTPKNCVNKGEATTTHSFHDMVLPSIPR